MRTVTCVCLWLITCWSVSAAPDDKDNTNPTTRFEACYHRWVAAIYDHPGTLLSSSSRSYTQFPEYNKIVALGPSALPAIAAEIESGGDMAMFLDESIIRITGWKSEDFAVTTGGLQDYNRLLLKRLRVEKLIPAR